MCRKEQKISLEELTNHLYEEQLRLLREKKVRLPRHTEVQFIGAGVTLIDHSNDIGWRLRGIPVIGPLMRKGDIFFRSNRK